VEDEGMGEIGSVLIVGAGAVGAAVASVLRRGEGVRVSVLADSGRADRYAAEGFVLNGERLFFPVLPARAAPPKGEMPDLVIVAVKSHNLAQAITDMAPYVGEGSLVLSLLNGITSEDELAAVFGREKVPYAMILGIDAVREGNATSFSSSGKIYFGDARNPKGAWSERVSRIASLFDRSGMGYVVPEDMIRALWYKFMINVGINQASAVLHATYGAFQRLPEAWAVMEAAMRELIAVSRALGTGLAESDIEAFRETLVSLSPGAKTSMLQDVEARRKTEVEAFAGVVVALGEKAGVATPVNRLLFDMIRTIEQSYVN
jgi:2-dehydropantoate 2-reductase